VIDAANFIAGLVAATVMADFGADVIKIEPPEGGPIAFEARAIRRISTTFRGYRPPVAVLREAGLTDTEIDRRRRDRVVA
jgi:hypothetical protein